MARSAVSPLIVIAPKVEVTFDEIAERVLDTRRKHGETLQQYHEVWYNSGHTWTFTHFLGVAVMKNPNDLWAYQTLIHQHRPVTIIETGTYEGGSALWFAYLQDMLQIDGGKVLTVDFEDQRKCTHPRVTFIEGDSTDPKLARHLLEQVEYPLLVVLDSDHAAAHVRKELELYAPALEVGDWLVVEDTNVAWGTEHTVSVALDSGVARCSCGRTFPITVTALDQIRCPVGEREEGDRGARGGLEDYLRAHPGEFRQEILLERWLLSCNPGGWLQRIAEAG